MIETFLVHASGHGEGKVYRWVYSISLSCWIMVGLAWAAAMIANVQDLYHSVVYPDAEEKEGVTTGEDPTKTVSTKVGLLLEDK